MRGAGNELTIYPRYLETAKPGSKFKAGGDLHWLDGLPSETIPLRFSDGRATLTYKPKTPGSYIAKWRVGAETLYGIEEQKRQVRFERECPNPIWWFDYTRSEKGAKSTWWFRLT